MPILIGSPHGNRDHAPSAKYIKRPGIPHRRLYLLNLTALALAHTYNYTRKKESKNARRHFPQQGTRVRRERIHRGVGRTHAARERIRRARDGAFRGEGRASEETVCGAWR